MSRSFLAMNDRSLSRDIRVEPAVPFTICNEPISVQNGATIPLFRLCVDDLLNHRREHLKEIMLCI